MNFKKYHVSKNLAPPMSDVWVDGYVNASTGGITQPTAANEKTSDYIDVHQYSYVSNCYENGDFPSRGTSTSTTAWYGLGCYREDKSFISRLINNLTYQLPAGTYYVRMCFRTFGETGNVMVNGGDTQLPYEPYSSEVWHDIPYYLHNTSTDTITTLPADIYANASTATVGLKGQTVQSGTPSPQNPVMPNGCGERTNNLFDKDATDTNNGYVANGYLASDGTINTNNGYRTSEYIPILSNQKYITYAAGLNAPSVCFYDTNKNYISGVNYAGRQYATFTTPSDAKYVRLSFRNVDGAIMFLNLGDTVLPYEPYGVKLPISSANTTTPVYLGEVQTTRRVKKLVLTGEESWERASNNVFYLSSITDYMHGNYTCWCTHFIACPNQAGTADVPNERICFGSGTLNRLFLNYSSFATTPDLKTYLQQQYANGTPISVWYVLATEQTAVVNEPLMRIGDYADEVSNISIPVTAGGDTLSVGTTVQPSEITANYKGWHPKTPKESNNGQWS